MYDIAKKSREAMKSKAKRLATPSKEKVSSADWTPPEELNADVKTGLRPLSRRAFKSGGKVAGECSKMRADRKPRKAGGKVEKREEKAEAKDIAIAKINRNVKEANQEREGKKHIGGMKRGGRAKKMDGGEMQGGKYSAGDRAKLGKMMGAAAHEDSHMRSGSALRGKEAAQQAPQARDLYTKDQLKRLERGYNKGGRTKKADGGKLKDWEARALFDKYNASHQAEKEQKLREKQKAEKVNQSLTSSGLKHGGRAKKMDGGPMMGMGMQAAAPDPRLGIVSPRAFNFSGAQGTPYKKGGKVHSDEAMDKALIKKMVKPEARTARKDGGKVKKGKTNINIVINAGQKQPASAMGMPPAPPSDAPSLAGLGAPPVPPPPMGAGAPPMPPGGPAGMPPMPPGGAPKGLILPPMGRKTGGRVTKVAKSYKDMEAGAGSGEGRLQKTDIAKRIPKKKEDGENVFDGLGYPNKVPGATGGRTAHKSGGKVYRSYKDMDAGAGSGKGRLEKTEIARKKR